MSGVPARKTKTKRLRARSRNESHPKLRSLKCFNEVHDRICRGWPLAEVARFIQDDRQEYSEVNRNSLIWTLNKYRDELPPGVLVAKAMPHAYVEAAQTVREGFNELDELQKLYKLQMTRIEIDHSTEKKMGKLFSSMTQEVKQAREILEAIGSLKMDLGLNERHLGKLDIETGVMAEVVGKYGKNSVNKVLANPESRQKLLAIANKFMQASQDDMPEVADKEAVTLEYCGEEEGKEEFE